MLAKWDESKAVGHVYEPRATEYLLECVKCHDTVSSLELWAWFKGAAITKTNAEILECN